MDLGRAASLLGYCAAARAGDEEEEISSMAFIQMVPGTEMLFNHWPGTGNQNLSGREST